MTLAITKKQAEALELLKTAGVPVPVEVPNKSKSRFLIHPRVAEVLVKLGYGEWERSEFVGGTTHIKYTGKDA